MKIDFTRPLTDFDGKPLIDGDKAVTLGLIAVNALTTPQEGDNALSGVEKIHRYDLARDIYKSTLPIEITAEDISTIKGLIIKLYHNVIVVGQALPMLETAANVVSIAPDASEAA